MHQVRIPVDLPFTLLKSNGTSMAEDEGSSSSGYAGVLTPLEGRDGVPST
jgi:hypothetical protein